MFSGTEPTRSSDAHEYGLALAVKKACIADILAINGSRCSPMMEIRRKQ